MYLHANAKLGLAGRFALVTAIDEGMSLRAAAGAFSVSPATAHRWWHRWLDGGRELGALLDRSSRPHRSPRLLASELAERICACRRQTGSGPASLPERRALRIRPSGRCCAARASPGARPRHGQPL
jgi:transposase